MSSSSAVGRGAVALALALAPVVGVASPAAAQTSSPPVVKTAWYWAEKTPVTPVAALPTLPDQADAAANVPDGDLGVGFLSDQLASRDKLAALDFDLTTIPSGSLFSRFTLTLPLDTAATNAQGTPADISACENIDVFTASAGPQSLDKAPPFAAPTCVKGVLDSAQRYVFDLTAMANEWSQGTPADGIAIVPTLLAATDMRPFSIALKGENAITTSAAWTPPASSPPVAAPPPAAPAAPSVALPPVLPGAVQPAVPPVAVPEVGVLPAVPAPQPQPQAAPPAAAVALRPAAFAPRSMVPTSLWWGAVLAVGAVLGLAWLTQSDPLVPQGADPRRARFARALRPA